MWERSELSPTRPQPRHDHGAGRRGQHRAAALPPAARSAERTHRDRGRRGHHPPGVLHRLAAGDVRHHGRQADVRRLTGRRDPHAVPTARPHRRPGQPAVPGRDDVRPLGQRRPTPTRSGSSTAPWTPASTSSTPPTSTPPASPRRSSARPCKGRRDDVVLATKFFMPMGETTPTTRGGSRRWIIRAVEDSLRRLGTDHIDLYQVHRPSPDTDVEETLGALTDLVRQGKVRYIGSSSYSGSQIVEAQWVSRDRHLERFVTEQPPYSILVRGIEEDVLPTAQRHGMGTLTYSPLGRRLAVRPLAQGRRRRPPPPRPGPSARFDMTSPANQRKLDVVEDLAQLAEQTGITLIELADRVRHQPPRRHLRDHRTPHHGAARVVPARRRHHPVRPRSSTASTRLVAPGRDRQPRRQQLRRPPNSRRRHDAADDAGCLHNRPLTARRSPRSTRAPTRCSGWSSPAHCCADSRATSASTSS